jgi:DNA-binding transcriptional LysR family regulator
MDLQDLTVLIAVCEEGSMSAASRRLHLALAAVSARVARLEDELGAALVERGARGVRPTPAGDTALRHARAALREVDALKHELAGGGEVRGRVRLWASTMAVTEHLPPVLGRLLAAHPGLQLHLEENSSSRILEALDEGRADVGVVSGVRIPRHWDDAPFAHDRLVLVVPAGHALATPAPVRLADALDAPFVGLDADSGIQRFLEGTAARDGAPMKVIVRVRAFDAILQLVACGAGLAVVPATSAARAPRGAVTVELSDGWALRTLRAIAPPRPRDAAARAVWAALAAAPG